MKFVEDYWKVKPTPLKAMAGRILISVPFFNDPFFSRTVILLTDFDTDSTAGLILNKKSEYSVQKIVSEIRTEDPIYVGGPLMTSGVFGIHNHQNTQQSVKLLPGVYLGYDDIFLDIIENQTIQDLQYKFFVGYSGWSPGQLENEISNEMWVVGNANPELIFNTSAEKIWSTAVIQLGDEYLHWLDIPKDINDN